MREQPVMLKVLLRDHHWQNYSTFCAEYDKAARQLDPKLAGSYPSRAQLHRWLTGTLRSLPYADHCRVLEEMFPGWTAEQLFQPATTELAWQSPAGHQAGPAVFAAPSTGLRPFIEQAFTREHVAIDFAGFSGGDPARRHSRAARQNPARPDQARHRHDPHAAAGHHQADEPPMPGR